MPPMLDDGVGGLPYRQKHVSGVPLVFTGEQAAVVITSNTTVVSTLTPLTGWLNLAAYHRLLFHGACDAAQNVALLVEFSDDGVHPDVFSTMATVTQSNAASIEMGPNILHQYWRFSATTADLSPQSLLWKVLGVPRNV